jgi:RimJ/RimL family protein N-acetyltransferase
VENPPFFIETARLILVATPAQVMQTRIEQSTGFSAEVPTPRGALRVNFPAEWPGDALALFPLWLEQTRHAPQEVPWGGILIDRAESVAVGQMGCKERPKDGGVEIGYGINPAYQKRGYASEMAKAFTDWILAQPGVKQVKAECRMDNTGSVRVLEKAGFICCGERVDVEDGLLFVWVLQ